MKLAPGGGTQYKSGYRDVPQTWVAKSGCQVHQWVPFFLKNMVHGWVKGQIWYFDGSIFQNFLKFAPKWRKFGTSMGQLFKKFLKFAPIWRKFPRTFLIFGTWMGHFSFKIGTWMGDGWCHFKIPRGTSLPRPKLSTPPGHFSIFRVLFI